MPLFGTLTTMPLPDLLQWLGTARRTGTLHVECDRVSKWLLFDQGQLIGCSSDAAPERLGHFLLSRGRITEEQLRIALVAQEATGSFLGRVLVDMRVMTEEQLSAHLEAKAEETVFSLFDWTDAVFRFHETLADDATTYRVRLSIEDVLLRGMQRIDEMRRIREVIPGPGAVLCRTATTPDAEHLASNTARQLYDLIDGHRTVAEILLHVHGSEYLVTKFLYELTRSGYAEVSEIRDTVPHFAKPAATAAIPVVAEVGGGGETGDLGSDFDVSLERSIAEDLGAVLDTGAKLEPAKTQRPESDPTAAPAAAGPATRVATPRAAAVLPPELPTEAEPLVGEELLDIPDVFLESSDVEPIEQSPVHLMERDLETARGHMAAGDYDLALDVLDRLYRKFPDDEALRRLTAEAEAAFRDKAYRHYLPAKKVPVLAIPPEQLEGHQLSSTDFYLLSRIDGRWDLRSIIQIAPLREIDALLSLKRLRERGIIDLKDPTDRRPV